MTRRPLLLCLMSAAFCSGSLQAAGFGELSLLSRIGEPLHVEIPILTSPGESIDSACFSLEPVKNADLPVVTVARSRLIKEDGLYRLSIVGGPVSEPLIMISVRAGCGIDLQRRFTLMPDAPVELARSVPTASVVAPRAAQATGADMPVRKSAPVAAAPAPRPAPKPAKPAPKAKAKPPVDVTPTHRTQAPPPPPAPSAAPEIQPAPPVRETPPELPKADRLVLGAPSEAAGAGKPPSESELRIRQLESSLSMLNEEVDRLNKALALTAETLSAQQKLQAAQAALQALPGNAPAAPAVSQEARNHWLELLLSAIVGGGLAAGLARLFASRKPHSTEEELPLAMAAPAPASVQTRHTAGSVTVDTTATANSAPPSPPSTHPVIGSAFSDFSISNSEAGLSFSEGDSIIELAEIMISFGRVRGAAEALAQHIDTHSPANIQPWLMLLDLYRRSDMRAEFESLGEKLGARFNIAAPVWESDTSTQPGTAALEAYPHILERISGDWGTNACLDYLYELVQGNRDGKRAGFPLAAVEEIVALIRVLEEAYDLQRSEA